MAPDAAIDAAPPSPTSAPIGPPTGFFAAVVYQPGSPHTVWASGDDGDGLYRSTDDGATWALVESAPLDWSAYALRFDPHDPRRIWAPSYFGRGTYRSDDSGATWARVGTGLPVGPGAAARIYDLAVRADGGELIAATGSGLFRSTDAGATFSSVTGGPSVPARAVIYAQGKVLAGADDGKLYTSTNGTTWTGMGGGGAITDLAAGAQGVYIATIDGLVVYTDLASTPQAVVNPVVDPARGTLLWTKLAVAPGTTRATDRVVVGTTVDAAAAVRDHIYLSDDGGATWTVRATGLDHASAFDLTFSPTDRDRIVLATVGAGLYTSGDAGRTWSAGGGDLRGAAALAFAVDPTNASHLLLGSSESLTGTPGVFETTDGGATWQLVRSLVPDALSFAFDPSDPRVVLVGTFATPGLLRSTNGTAGPWTPIANVPSAMRIRTLGTAWYALALDGTAWRSTDHGATWTKISAGALVTDIAPLASGGELACGNEMRVSTDGFATSQPVALPTLPSGEIVTSCVESSGGALIGTNKGRVFSTSTLSGTSTTWTAHATPLLDADVRQVGVVDGAWLVCGMRADVEASPNTISGLFRSVDHGATWTVAAETYPSRLCWSFAPVGDGIVLEALWGGGAWRVVLPR